MDYRLRRRAEVARREGLEVPIRVPDGARLQLAGELVEGPVGTARRGEQWAEWAWRTKDGKWRTQRQDVDVVG